jgi:hypothetical protein
MWRGPFFGRHRRAAVAAAGTVLALAVPPALAAPVSGRSGPGCDSSRAAVAHYGSGVVVHPQPAGAPIPCSVMTGFGGSETRIAITRDNTVVYEPATLAPGAGGTGYVAGAPGPHLQSSLNPGGLAVTSNKGATWRFVKPAGLTWVPQDDQLYVDRTTGRIFYYALSSNPFPQGGNVPVQDQLAAGYAHLLVSADDGASWSHTALAGFVESENPRFATAPPPAGLMKPGNYPDVAYWCGNNVLFTETNRSCYRSLDGGTTWAHASTLFSQPVPQHHECGSNAETFNSGDGNYPEGGSDGSLFVLVSCGASTFLAKSTDEGSTWPILKDASGAALQIPPADELRVDERGNLYAVRLAGGNQLLLRISRDGGLSWSAPLDMTAPGVTSINEWFMAERGSEVVVSYLGHQVNQVNWDGYLTVTRDATTATPVLWSTTINDPRVPMYVGAPAPARDDFIGADIGPDGAPWGSFFASCPANATDPVCAGQSSDPQANAAVAGRLAGLRP